MEMGKRHGGRRRLDRRTWALAALEAFAEGGPGSVAVEAVARRLGTTKGSFYWHFRDRQALLVEALELYERERTELVIATLEHQHNAGDQLRSLSERVFRDEGGDDVYHALLANASHPIVAPVLRRITTRRVDYLTKVMAELGFPPAEARHRAMLAYTTWLGLVQTERAVGGRLFRTKRERARYVGFLAQLLHKREVTEAAAP
jgi:AcrR family transcriptional regulator